MLWMRPSVLEECGRRLRLVLEFGGILLAWIRLGIGLFCIGDLVGGLLGDVSFLGAMVFVFPFPFLLFFFLFLGAQGF